MNENKTIKVLKPLYGCDFSDSERVNTLADADWLTRRLTALYSFAITLDTSTDETTGEVKGARLLLTGLWMGDRVIEHEAEKTALAELKEILHLPSLVADTPDSIRTILEAVARDISGIRNYYDF